ncbi:putative ABC transport system permease protein [Clostridium cavendishii DSM 21758]|uniref:Putative ABC transport system permease protein n=1 Tax=Clostridium cavendishii DSM 21758 TaxID=1121302 RepID=A0A1M6TGX3_9CLOT|nr:ABC transporter permease [Clostridium cavendishii]SHK56193.1 putative ABC transport system permease protein [Clostridium cavendishii DSM 21758]
MSLFDIAVKNIKRNFSNYMLYFVSMVFSIMMYFIFSTMQYSDSVDKALKSSSSVKVAVGLASGVLVLFVAIFIWYSNSFFTRKRKREVGLYSMLGVRKKDISKMLFYETLVMGLIALVVGIILGILLANLFIMLLLKLMDFTSVSIGFVISLKAIIKTFIVFFIIFFIVSMNSKKLIYKFKLIDLFKAESTGETEPKASGIKALLAIIIIGAGYIFSTKIFTLEFLSMSTLTLIFTVVGTYLLFSSFVVFVVKLSKRNKNKYYNGINMIGTSQLLYRIKGNARTLATIAILSATTLTTVGIAYSFYYNIETTQRKIIPYSYIFKDKNDNNKKFEDLVRKYPENEILVNRKLTILNSKISMEGYKKEFFTPIISLTDYNMLVKDIKKSEGSLELKKGQAFVADSNYVNGFSSDYKNKKVGIKGKNLNIIDFEKESPIGIQISMNELVVLNDEAFKDVYNENEVMQFNLYNVKDDKHAEGLTNDFNELIAKDINSELKHNDKKTEFNGMVAYATNYYEGYKASMMFTGIFIFIGGFLGLVFLLSTGSIIFFKQLSEATNDKGDYKILRKIGVSEKEVKYAINKQIFIVFLLPLIVGAIHAYMAVRLLEPLFNKSLIIPMLVTLGAYTAIYIMYYFLTRKAYYKIISEK